MFIFVYFLQGIKLIGELIDEYSLPVVQAYMGHIQVRTFRRYLLTSTQSVSCTSLHGTHTGTNIQALLTYQYTVCQLYKPTWDTYRYEHSGVTHLPVHSLSVCQSTWDTYRYEHSCVTHLPVHSLSVVQAYMGHIQVRTSQIGTLETLIGSRQSRACDMQGKPPQ